MFWLFFSLFIVAIIVFSLLYIVLEKDRNHLKKVADNLNDNKKIYVDKSVIKKGLEGIKIKNEKILEFKTKISENIIGMDNFVNAMIISMLCEGNLLVEGFPGLAKTKTISTFAKLLGLDFNRIQFTPDMMPSDIIGIDIWNPGTKNFETHVGPLMTNVLLADEINRTSPKVQSALLEAMQEKQVTIGGKTLQLPEPFFLLATQNPIEQEGTYPLPEAQIDRFLFKAILDYPNNEQEKKILDMDLYNKNSEKNIKSTISIDDIKLMKNQISKVKISDKLKEYIIKIVSETRNKDNGIYYGSSPRGSIAVMESSRVLAYLRGNDEVELEDIWAVVLLTLRHRIILNYDLQARKIDADDIISDIVAYCEF